MIGNDIQKRALACVGEPNNRDLQLAILPGSRFHLFEQLANHPFRQSESRLDLFWFNEQNVFIDEIQTRFDICQEFYQIASNALERFR